MRSYQLGVGLIEVLIALVILSIGLLGMMSMQLTSLQQGNNAYMRTQATIHAMDILDRARSNQTALNNYFVAQGTANANCLDWQSNVTGCSASALALADVHNWQTALGNALPSGAGRVCRSDQLDDTPGAPDCESNDSNFPVVVYIWWQESRDANAPVEMFAMAAEIR